MKKVTLVGFFFIASFLMFAQKGVNILIKTGIPNAVVMLNGNWAGNTGPDGNLIIKQAAPGKHEIKIVKPGYFDIRQTITVSELNNSFTFTMKLIPTAQPNPQKNDIGTTEGVKILKESSDGSLDLTIPLIIVVIISMALVVIVLIRNLRHSVRINTIGKFELHKIIGKGGIAIIWKARDLVTKKIVALKVMENSLKTDEDLVYKFFCEGEVISKINSEFPDAPVVKVLEFGRDREKLLGIPFIAMEYVKGDSLLKLIQQEGNLSIPRKLHIAREVARGLGAAHKLGIFHGDITPDNIIVDGNKVTLIDFGVSLQRYESYKNMDASIMGKPTYMSPEQCAGDPIDEKSDVYSLGVILFFMFYGRPPFISRNPMEIMNMHKESPLPDLRMPVPGDIRVLIYRLLDKNSQIRPNTAELEEKLAQFIGQYEINK